MSSLSSVIEYILQKKSIVEYLDKKGFHPFKKLSGGKLSYLCPLPGHTETKPSFFVWTNSDYENFYCFGCQRSNNIINLVSYMENLTLKEAIQKLSDGINFSVDDDIELILERIHKNSKISSMKSFLSDELITASLSSQFFSKFVSGDAQELEMLDKFWSKIDEYMFNYDIDQLSNISEVLTASLRDRQKKIISKKNVQH